MAEYASLISNLNEIIISKIDDKDKSNQIITILKKILNNPTQKTKPNTDSTDKKISCSSFSNYIIQFICKINKYKDTICNLPGAVSWMVGKDKIETVLTFMTTNDTFTTILLQQLQLDTDKTQLRKLLEDIKKTNIDGISNNACSIKINAFDNTLSTKMQPAKMPMQTNQMQTNQTKPIQQMQTNPIQQPDDDQTWLDIDPSRESLYSDDDENIYGSQNPNYNNPDYIASRASLDNDDDIYGSKKNGGSRKVKTGRKVRQSRKGRKIRQSRKGRKVRTGRKIKTGRNVRKSRTVRTYRK
jgi:hypothetical protein